MRTADQYVTLITSEHRDKPRFAGSVRAVVNPLAGLQVAFANLELAFDLDTAVGNQLDAVGERVGLSRLVSIPNPDIWFSFDDTLRGWDRGIWYDGHDPGSHLARMEDGAYRTAIRAKILANETDGTIVSLKAVLDQLFADTAGTHAFIQGNTHMQAIIGVAGRIPSLLFLMLLYEDYIPITPAGISTQLLVTSVDNTPIFGFDIENEYISGWDAGSFGVSPEYIIEHGA